MPSQTFMQELGQTSVSELADVLPRYIREACAADPQGAAQTLSSAVYSALPDIEGDGNDPPRLLKVADFMAEIGEPPPSLVADFIPAQKLLLMSGAAKQGKSLVGLEALHCVSTGHKLMGRFPVDQPGAVVYFGLEDGGHEIKSRLTQRGITDLDNFYICWQSFDMSTPQGFEMFKRLIYEMDTPPALIIIDTAREAFRVRDWNDATAVGNAISPLRKWAHKNCTVILITHNNKDKFASGVNKISGSGALVSSCDSFMILENQKALENGDLRWDWEMAGRGVKTTKYKLQMDTHTLHVRVLDDKEIDDAAIEDKKADREEWYAKVATIMSESHEARCTINHIKNALEIQSDFPRTLVNEMVNRNEARKTEFSVREEGVTGRSSYLYELTSRGASSYLFCDTGQGSMPKKLTLHDTEDF